MIMNKKPTHGERVMKPVERITVTITPDMVALINGAVKGGLYASASEIVREALRLWHTKRAGQIRKYSSLRAEIQKGLARIDAGSVDDLEVARVVAMAIKHRKRKTRGR